MDATTKEAIKVRIIAFINIPFRIGVRPRCRPFQGSGKAEGLGDPVWANSRTN
jgi:hypothetical protein